MTICMTTRGNLPYFCLYLHISLILYALLPPGSWILISDNIYISTQLLNCTYPFYYRSDKINAGVDGGTLLTVSTSSDQATTTESNNDTTVS